LDHAAENSNLELYKTLYNTFPYGIAVSENYIVAYDAETQTLNLFDKTGKFLNHIARRGLRTNEFDAINSIQIDEFHQKIYILDWRKLHNYTLHGCYINTIHLGNGDSDGFIITKNGTILVHHGAFDTNIAYTLYDTLGNTLYTHPQAVQFHSSLLNPFFNTDFCSYLFEGHAHVKGKNDTLFRVEAGSITPRFIFTTDYDHTYRMMSIAETPLHLVFETEKSSDEPIKQWCYHKRTGKLYYTLPVEKSATSLPLLVKESNTMDVLAIHPISFTEHVNGVSFRMIAIPEGSYERRNVPDPNFSVHIQYVNDTSTVQLNSYYIAETEVTQALWQVVMGEYHPSYDGFEQKPVNNVSWIRAIDFIKKLNTLTGKSFRLPSEAEWEYAAGGAELHLTKWSGTDRADELSKYAHFIEGKGNHALVKSKLPNRMGLYDMTGNVYEWCMDWYAEQPDEKMATNPKGSITGKTKVFKGQYYIAGSSERPHVTHRGYLPLHVANYMYGFRLAMSAP